MDETTTDLDVHLDFDLDVTFAEKATAIAELMNKTSDNCGATSQSACVGCVID